MLSVESSTRMTPGLVSVVLLNWNGGDATLQAIKSVCNQTYASIQIVLVDNCSADHSLRAAEELLSVQQKFSYLVIKNESNLGFAKGMNNGITASDGEFVLPLGQDVYLEENYVQYAVDKFRSDDKIGVIGGVEWEWPESSNAFDKKTPRAGQGPHFLNRFFRSKKDRFGGDLIRCFGVTGSFPVIRGKTLSDVCRKTGDNYDEMFVTGYEDMDLWFRINLCGWLVCFTAKTGGWHVGSGSVGGNQGMFEKDLEYQMRIFRNRYFILIKNCSFKIFIRNFFHVLAFELLLPVYLLIFQRSSLKSYVRALAEVIRSFKKLVGKRRLVQSASVISFKDFSALFR